ncbi:MAG: HAD family hydrolase [Promethearchaeota archaeon]
MSKKKEIIDLELLNNPPVLRKQKVKLYKIKHFIFDFGGVLVEKTFVLKNLFSIIESDLKIRIPRREESLFIKKLRRQTVAGIIDSREFLEKLLDKYYYPYQKKNGSLPPKKVNIDYYLEIWFNLYSKLAKLSSEMEEIIQRLHGAGYIVSLMSNTYDIHAKSNELRGFFEIFDHVFLSNEIGYFKPDLEKYKHVLQNLDTKPNRCVFIDDKLSNLIPARELGMIVIKFESLEQFKKQLRSMGIHKLRKNLRQEIKKKYKKYKLTKKEYKKAKKEYKKAKEEFLKRKKKSLKRKEQFHAKHAIYKRKKIEYKREKEKKKELISKF